MYNDIIDFLKVNRIVHRIKALQKLPSFGKKFDLINAYAICFNNHDQPDLWGVDEWTFFLQDLKQNHLKENGRIVLALNPEKDDRNDKVFSFFEDKGGKLMRLQ